MSVNIPQTLVRRLKNLNNEIDRIYSNGLEASFNVICENFDFLEQRLLNGEITIVQANEASNKENVNSVNETTIGDGKRQSKKKGRGRPRIASILHEKRTDSSSTAKSESPVPASLDDSQASSTSSTRSKRAAAQAVGEKMEKVKSLLSNKKLRRPTNFDEKKPQVMDVNSPPSKSRKIRQNQSAGSSPDESETKETNTGEKSSPNTRNWCNVVVERMSTPEVVKALNKGDSNKRRSEDIFDEKSPHNANTNKLVKYMNTTQTVNKEEPQSKQLRGKKGTKNEASSSENEGNEPVPQISPIAVVNQSIAAALGQAIAHSSPLAGSPSSEKEFHGFDIEPIVDKPTRSKRGKQRDLAMSDKAELVQEQSIHVNQRVTRKTVNNAEAGTDVEVVETETNFRSRTKVLKKASNEEKRAELNNQTYICEDKEDEATVRSRTRVIKKASNPEDGLENPPSTTRVIKNDNQHVNAENSADVSPAAAVKPLTKSRLNKTNSQSSSDESSGKSQTKTMNKRAEMGGTLQKKLVVGPSRSPATAKGDLVRKRVEDFEKIKQNNDQEEENPTRVTRQAAKIMATSELKSGKTPSSLPRPVPVNIDTVVIQKAAVEETEKRMKEERRIKRQAKEEEVVKNKEKLLKATAEEAKRKREEKNQKAAVAREAAEREKAFMAAKAEREKEEKLRQMQAEKEKLKQEALKKKILAQQKAQVHEERRRQEEAARLARLREQEEEHKRALAMKEREMDLQKKQKAQDMRLAEAEKAKQTSKLAKIAAINSAKAKEVSTPTPSSVKTVDSYEITPSRDERPLLKPKTETDYGIEDANSSDSSEDEENPRKKIPSWAQAQRRVHSLKEAKYLPDWMRDNFFENSPKMPDAADIFKGFPMKKRIRTSSAVWRTPPLGARN